MSRHSHAIRQALLPALVLAAALALAGCDDDPYAVPMARLVVTQEPAVVDAPWRLEGEHGYVFTGHGSGIVHGLRSGTYTFIWLDVWGWDAPPRQTVEVRTSATSAVAGTYRAGRTVFPDTPDTGCAARSI